MVKRHWEFIFFEVGVKFNMVKFQVCSEIIKPVLILQEYIPIRLEWKRKVECVKYLEFYDGTKSLLEIVIGEETKKLHRIVVVSCYNYSISDSVKVIDNFRVLDDMGLAITTEKEREMISCSLNIVFYDKAIHINLCKKNEIFQYIKNGRVQFGMDRLGNLKRIIIMDLTDKEKEHISQELEMQR